MSSRIPGCDCKMIHECVCRQLRGHAEECPYRRAVVCPVAISCEDHGRDVCPVCDLCTCGGFMRKGVEGRLWGIIGIDPATEEKVEILGIRVRVASDLQFGTCKNSWGNDHEAQYVDLLLLDPEGVEEMKTQGKTDWVDTQTFRIPLYLAEQGWDWGDRYNRPGET